MSASATCTSRHIALRCAQGRRAVHTRRKVGVRCATWQRKVKIHVRINRYSTCTPRAGRTQQADGTPPFAAFCPVRLYLTGGGVVSSAGARRDIYMACRGVGSSKFWTLSVQRTVSSSNIIAVCSWKDVRLDWLVALFLPLLSFPAFAQLSNKRLSLYGALLP